MEMPEGFKRFCEDFYKPLHPDDMKNGCELFKEMAEALENVLDDMWSLTGKDTPDEETEGECRGYSVLEKFRNWK